MEDNKIRNIIIIMLGVILLLLIFMIYLLINNNYGSNNDEVYDRLEIIDNTIEDNIEDNGSSGSDVTNDATDNSGKSFEIVSDSNNTNIDGNNNTIKDNSNVSYNEEEVTGYFENNYNEIKGSGFKSKFKDYFIEIVDFIFYGTEIKGHTFNELTDTLKSLGYKAPDIKKILSNIDSSKPLELQVKDALKLLLK